MTNGMMTTTMATSSVPMSGDRLMLRHALETAAPRLGLDRRAIDLLVTTARLVAVARGQRIFAADGATDVVYFLAAGAARIICKTDGPTPVTVRIQPPGSFLNLAAGAGPGRPQLGAVAHLPCLVAVVPAATMVRILGALPPTGVLRLAITTWGELGDLVQEKCRLLALPLRERLIQVLERLARDFGRVAPEGVAIELPLTHRDLAALAAATRANVSRALGWLARDGRVQRCERRVVLRHRAA